MRNMHLEGRDNMPRGEIMSTAQHARTAISQVYIHPAVASNIPAIRRIERETGCAAVWLGRRARLVSTSRLTETDNGPWGGDAA